MKTIHAIIAAMLFLSVIGIANALPVTLQQVEIDGTTVVQNAFNQLSIERGQTYDLRIRFTPFDRVRNAEVRAFISGYEFSDIDSIDDRTPVFDADTNVTYVKRLTVRIPDELDQDSYKLRIVISDRFGDDLTADYNLQIDAPRNSLKIDDVILNPSSSVRAGSSLLARVRVDNKGERDQEDVRVTITLPELGVSGTQYLSEIKSDETEETEEILLRLPRCAKAGTYDATIDVEFSNRHRKISEKKSITVLPDETCTQDTPVPSANIGGSQIQTVNAGDAALFPLTVTNPTRSSKTFTISVPAIPASDWAEVTITPTSTLVLAGGQSQTVSVNVQTNEDAPAGAHSLVTTVTNGNAQQQVTLTTTVIAQGGARTAFAIVLMILLVLLVAIVIIIGIAYARDREKTQTYY
ncbi:hypothetical protein J4211_01100 [Candidatus Woesearchaeota archaeon]|nr:hypothetical protein [Candidatus Woesearchaeota archaeon]